ncbi:MAG: RNA polymerase sigma-70 factor [Chitinophagaceae bacterium]|nr:RNA polymerase sigma-70 factor [Chitinophagaceae bacterium]
MKNQIEFEQLFRSHYADCVRFAYSFMKNTADAEEVVQDVFLKLWEKKATIDIQTSPKAYLFTAIRNKAYEYHRKKTSSPGMLPEEYLPGNLSVNESHIENKQLETSLQEAITTLPEKCREVFLLSRDQQLKHRQIAEQLNISVKTVENHIGKALKILYSSIEHLLLIIISFIHVGVLIHFFI